MNKILLFDNYDSFTYNLLHAIRSLGYNQVDVCRNDRISLEDIDRYDKILLSPGPGIPSEAGILLPLIRRYAPTKNILGVCLGEQAIAEAFGARLLNLEEVVHGIQTPIHILKEDLLFRGLEPTIEGGRYHSWVVNKQNLPETLEVTAEDDAGQIMALRHRTYRVRGIQFHPESVLTPQGTTIIRNWLESE